MAKTALKNNWLFYGLTTFFVWGLWGAFSEIPVQYGFPSTMIFVVWAGAMAVCALVVLAFDKWKLPVDRRSAFLGSMVGFLGAAGQVMLFQALRFGPAYIVFPIVSMSPVVTIILSMFLLGERADKVQVVGIVLALAAIFFLSLQDKTDENIKGIGWLFLALGVFLAWGVQGFYMKRANGVMASSSVFVYMALWGVILAPVVLLMTDFHAEGVVVNAHLVTVVFFTQILNAIGALTLNFAYRYGKAIVVSPMQGLAPVLSVIISLVLYRHLPDLMLTAGLVLATAAIVLLSIEPKHA